MAKAVTGSEERVWHRQLKKTGNTCHEDHVSLKVRNHLTVEKGKCKYIICLPSSTTSSPFLVISLLA